MGADLILLTVPVDLDADTAHTRLAARSDTELAAAWCRQEWGSDAPATVAEQLAEHHLDGPGIRQRFVDALACCYQWRRDVNLCDLGGRWWAITGGMSWGDPPTGAYALLGPPTEIDLTWEQWEPHTDDRQTSNDPRERFAAARHALTAAYTYLRTAAAELPQLTVDHPGSVEVWEEGYGRVEELRRSDDVQRWVGSTGGWDSYTEAGEVSWIEDDDGTTWACPDEIDWT